MNAYKILKTALSAGLCMLVLNIASPLGASQAKPPPGTVGNSLQRDNQPSVQATDIVAMPECDPKIDIRKQQEGPDTRYFPSGSNIRYEVVVTNTGNVELSNVEVTDDEVTDCNRYIGTLAIDQSYPYTCEITNATSSFTNVANVKGEFNLEWVYDRDPSSVEIVPSSYNITIGYEDLKLISSSDFDYNDWVISMLTDLQGSYLDADTILLEKISFTMTPMARGAALGHEFHLRFLAETFRSDGDARLVIQDRLSGEPLKSEVTDFIASAPMDFLINFDISDVPHKCDCEAFGDHPQSDMHNIRNTDEDNDMYNVPARRVAVLSLTFYSPVLFNLPTYGQHCEGLFFDPHLHVNAAEPYEITWMRADQQSEPRILCVQDPGWEWPEERIRIDHVYNRVLWLGQPTFFEVPPGWDVDPNTCVFDDMPCLYSSLYLPVMTR